MSAPVVALANAKEVARKMRNELMMALEEEKHQHGRTVEYLELNRAFEEAQGMFLDLGMAIDTILVCRRAARKQAAAEKHQCPCGCGGYGGWCHA